MAIDYGGRRIGIAVSDSGVVATPHSVVKNEGDVIAKLATLARDVGAETIVVGLPRRARRRGGEEWGGGAAARARERGGAEVPRPRRAAAADYVQRGRALGRDA